jgi:hypothetical protein
MGPSEASLVGPWFRYRCEDLGFQIPVANDWRETSVSHGVVFTMQYAPKPYVRVAIGRIAVTPGDLEPLIASLWKQTPTAHFRREGCRVDGQKAVVIEGTDSENPFRDVFIEKGPYLYWIGFAADRKDLWTQYSETFNIIVQGFHFI